MRTLDTEARPQPRCCCLRPCSDPLFYRRWKRRCSCAGVVALCVAAVPLILHWAFSHQGYDEGRAVEYAKLAGAAYCGREELKNWSCGSKCTADVSKVHYCEGTSTNAYVALWEKRCIVSFMGTQEYRAMLTDLEFFESEDYSICTGCRVHDGFLAEWHSLKPCVTDSLKDLGCPRGSKIRVTGHSLGAALSAIAMMSLNGHGWWIEESYNFGMPRTGDEQFAKKFNELFNGRVFRVTHHQDPVPQLPPSKLVSDWRFQHVEPEIFYDGDVAGGHLQCKADSDVRCSGQYSALASVMKDMLMHVGDHLTYMDIEIGTAGCGKGGSAGPVQATEAFGDNASVVV